MKRKFCLICTGLVVGLSSISGSVFACDRHPKSLLYADTVSEEIDDDVSSTETTTKTSATKTTSTTEVTTAKPTTTTVETTTETTTAKPTTTTTETTTETTTAKPTTTTTETTTETTTAKPTTTTTETTTETTTAKPTTTTVETTTETTTAKPTTTTVETTTAKPTTTTTEATTQSTTTTTEVTTVATTTETTTETTTAITVDYILNNYSCDGTYSPAISNYGKLYLSNFISDTSCKWIMDSQASEYFTISSDGVLTSVVRKGRGVVYAYNTAQKKYYKFTIREKTSSSSSDVTEVNNTSTIYIKTNQTKDLYSYVESDIVASAYTWKTDDDDICSVTSKGVIKGVDSGDTYIRCYYYDSIRSYSYKFHVYVDKSSSYSSKGTSSSKSTVVTVTETTTEATTKAAKTSSKSSTTVDNSATTTDYAAAALNKFNDISHRSWAIEAIGSMVDKGYIVGVSDTSFLPDNFCTRGDFSIVLAKMLNLSENSSTQPYDDVYTSNYFYSYVNAIKSANADAGVVDNKFRPTDYITREEAFTMVYKALVATGKQFDTSDAVLSNYSDSSEITSAEYRTAISALLNANLISGTGVGIEPSSTITRAQMAVLLNNIYNQTTI